MRDKTKTTRRDTRTGAQSITTCLWFDGQAEEAAKFYVSLFPNSHVDNVAVAPADFPSGKKGDVLTVDFSLMGQSFQGLNGGPLFKFNEAVSFVIPCKDQAEVDRYWKALSAVPEAEQCGWVKDRFGVSWQIVPTILSRLLTDSDRAKAERVMEAMLQMKKLDIRRLKEAHEHG
ncbi:MAG TPA: VOC family protein [Thermoplasmata archaeon]|jgi:predicted 3-demethylubiquinone-9 3-methyltransferase (glyoxalase superfamily)